MPEIEKVIKKLEDLQKSKIEDLKKLQMAIDNASLPFGQQIELFTDRDYDVFIKCLKGLPKKEGLSLTDVDMESSFNFTVIKRAAAKNGIEPKEFSQFFIKFKRAFRQAKFLIMLEDQNLQKLNKKFSSTTTLEQSPVQISASETEGKEVTKEMQAGSKKRYKLGDTGLTEQDIKDIINEKHDQLFNLVKVLPVNVIKEALSDPEKRLIDMVVTRFIDLQYIHKDPELATKCQHIKDIAKKLGLLTPTSHAIVHYPVVKTFRNIKQHPENHQHQLTPPHVNSQERKTGKDKI